MRRRDILVGDPKIQGIFGVTVGNGNVFTGEVNGNLPIGNGSYTKANGEKYTGYFEDGMMKGQFLIEYPIGDIYRGGVDEDGIKEGKGVYTWPSGSRYEGEWRDGEKHGQGVHTWPSGSRYEGEWREDVKHGQGVYTWPDGSRYEGEWRDGDHHGHGVKIWGPENKNAGDRYEGEWRVGDQHGQGVYTWSDGGRYEGEWKDGYRHGQGIQTWGPESKWAGDIYEGEFNQSKRNGWGRYIFKNDNKWAEYDGEWIDNDFTGYGKMVYKDESIYNGQWRSDKREGQGLLFWPNGTCVYGQMKNDEISHGMTMTPDLVITYPPNKNTTYNEKGFKVINFTGGEIKCFQDEKDISCYNKPNDIETIRFGGFKHYYTGDRITIRKTEFRDGFGEYGIDGGYYIGEWKQDLQSGFGLKNEPNLPTIIGTFENGILEGLGASISFSSKHRTVYLGGYKKGQPDGPGMFIYPDGEKVLGYFIEGKLDHSKNPIYLHSDGTRDSLVPTSG